MSTQAQLAAQLNTVTDQLIKIGAEVKTENQLILDLKDQLAAEANVSPELQAAFDKLSTQAQVVDDLIPDLPAPPPEAPSSGIHDGSDTTTGTPEPTPVPPAGDTVDTGTTQPVTPPTAGE